jgi:hypothetical protein
VRIRDGEIAEDQVLAASVVIPPIGETEPATESDAHTGSVAETAQ